MEEFMDASSRPCRTFNSLGDDATLSNRRGGIMETDPGQMPEEDEDEELEADGGSGAAISPLLDHLALG